MSYDDVTDYIGKQVRAKNAYHSEEWWADIIGITKDGDDLAFLVAYPDDGERDTWIIGDPDDYYEFRDVPEPDADVIAGVRQKLRNATTDDISDADIREIIAVVRAAS